MQPRPRSQGRLRALVSRSGSSMRKSFALCEAFGLTPLGPRALAARRGETAPFPSPWIPSAREGLSAGKLPPTQPSVRRGVRVEDDHGRSACSRGAAVKLHVEITSRS
jgi:hypothetical protein